MVAMSSLASYCTCDMATFKCTGVGSMTRDIEEDPMSKTSKKMPLKLPEFDAVAC